MSFDVPADNEGVNNEHNGTEMEDVSPVPQLAARMRWVDLYRRQQNKLGWVGGGCTRTKDGKEMGPWVIIRRNDMKKGEDQQGLPDFQIFISGTSVPNPGMIKVGALWWKERKQGAGKYLGGNYEAHYCNVTEVKKRHDDDPDFRMFVNEKVPPERQVIVEGTEEEIPF